MFKRLIAGAMVGAASFVTTPCFPQTVICPPHTRCNFTIEATPLNPSEENDAATIDVSPSPPPHSNHSPSSDELDTLHEACTRTTQIVAAMYVAKKACGNLDGLTPNEMTTGDAALNFNDENCTAIPEKEVISVFGEAVTDLYPDINPNYIKKNSNACARAKSYLNEIH